MLISRIKKGFHSPRAIQGPSTTNILKDRSSLIDKIGQILHRIFLIISYFDYLSHKIFIFYNDDEQREQHYDFKLFSMLSAHPFHHHIGQCWNNNCSSLYLGKNRMARIIIFCSRNLWKHLLLNKIWANGADQSNSNSWILCSSRNGTNNALYYDIICL